MDWNRNISPWRDVARLFELAGVLTLPGFSSLGSR